MANKKLRVDRDIRSPEVFLIDQHGEKAGKVSLRDALTAAREADMHLVEVAPNASPPVCKIMDYGKHLFGQKKKQQKPKKSRLKEVKIRPSTEENDYQVKLRNIIRFLEDGNKVKVTMRFRGRELWHRDLGATLFQRMETDLESHGTVEQEVKLEGRQMTLMLAPKRKSGV